MFSWISAKTNNPTPSQSEFEYKIKFLFCIAISTNFAVSRCMNCLLLVFGQPTPSIICASQSVSPSIFLKSKSVAVRMCWSRVRRSRSYAVQSKRKCSTSSVLPVAHTEQVLSFKSSCFHLPVSTANIFVPLNAVINLLASLSLITLRYSSCCRSNFRVLYSLSFGFSSNFAFHSISSRAWMLFFNRFFHATSSPTSSVCHTWPRFKLSKVFWTREHQSLTLFIFCAFLYHTPAWLNENHPSVPVSPSISTSSYHGVPSSPPS